MSNFTAIRAVTDTLKSLLLAELPGIAVEETKSPVDLSSNTTLVGLYLFRVEANPFTANLDWQPTSATQYAGPPLGINMQYLITPYGPDELAIQQTLGEVMRAFHERPVIRAGDPVLSPDLATMTEELRIVPRMLSLTDILDLWRAFERVSYRLCVTYEVSTVLIDSQLTRNVQRVQERAFDLVPQR
ncbi:MAG: DUF4255 domain-containing protein [Gemmatimonadaceae bacterium]